MSFYKPLQFPDSDNERKHERHSVSFAGRVRELRAVPQVARVTDVSIGGCRIAGVDVPQGAELWVALGLAPPVRARVVWTKGNQAGCAFYTPLSRLDLRNVLLQRFSG